MLNQRTRSKYNAKKADGVIEAAHFGNDGKLLWVRAYERRGPTWSDLVLLDRTALVARLKAHKRFYVGTRRQYLASEFDLTLPVRLAESGHGSYLVAGSGNQNIPQDQMEGVPVV